jgi:hypothetical protein
MNELFSVGDDQAIWKWDMNGEAVSVHLSFLILLIGLKNNGD